MYPLWILRTCYQPRHHDADPVLQESLQPIADFCVQRGNNTPIIT